MVIKTETLKDICSKILLAVDSSDYSTVSETLQLKTNGKTLEVSVTNREYYTDVKIELDEETDFHATVNATLFLKLISQITTEFVELSVNDNSMLIKANGSYNLPLIFDGDALLELPVININNPSVEFDVDTSILSSILTYNTKEINKGTFSQPVQKYYYVDENGAITFTSGACVNNFTLEQPVSMLLNTKIVKLFKLFTSEKVHFTLGHDAISDEIVQTKVKFETNDVVITAILSCDDSMLNSVPVKAIRGRASSEYPYSVSVNKDALVQSINRLMLFSTIGKANVKPYGKFEFGAGAVTVFDANKTNQETIKYENDTSGIEDKYEMTLDLNDLKITLENCKEQYITMRFGDGQAIVIIRNNVYNVIPEVVSM